MRSRGLANVQPVNFSQSSDGKMVQRCDFAMLRRSISRQLTGKGISVADMLSLAEYAPSIGSWMTQRESNPEHMQCP